MRLLLLAVAVVLGGCAQRTIVVKGDLPFTAWVAEQATWAHWSMSTCANPRVERREAHVEARYSTKYVYLHHDCRQ
jgi:hypothetical protein